MTLSVVDPIDNNVAVGDNHPIILTGIGMRGTAVFKTSVRLEVGPRIGSCLEVSMISGDDTSVSSAVLDERSNGQCQPQLQRRRRFHRQCRRGGVRQHRRLDLREDHAAKDRDARHARSAATRWIITWRTARRSRIRRCRKWLQIELITNAISKRIRRRLVREDELPIQQSSSAGQRKERTPCESKVATTSSDVAAQDVPVNSLEKWEQVRISRFPSFPARSGPPRPS